LSDAPGPAVDELGQNRRGHGGEQCVERRCARRSGDTVPVEAFRELIGFDGLSGSTSGEEPVAVGMSGAADVARLLEKRSDESGQPAGQGHQFVADAQRMPVRQFEVGRAKAVDPGERERIEQHQATSNAVDQVDAFVDEEAAEEVEALVLGNAAGRGGTVGRQFERRSAVGADGPFKKERECRRVLGPWANQVSTSRWVQVTRSVPWSRSQARSLTAILVCARTVE
jgi:hypothetical protein